MPERVITTDGDIYEITAHGPVLVSPQQLALEDLALDTGHAETALVNAGAVFASAARSFGLMGGAEAERESDRLLAPLREINPLSSALGAALPFLPGGVAAGLAARGAGALTQIGVQAGVGAAQGALTTQDRVSGAVAGAGGALVGGGAALGAAAAGALVRGAANATLRAGARELGKAALGDAAEAAAAAIGIGIPRVSPGVAAAAKDIGQRAFFSSRALLDRVGVDVGATAALGAVAGSAAVQSDTP